MGITDQPRVYQALQILAKCRTGGLEGVGGRNVEVWTHLAKALTAALS